MASADLFDYHRAPDSDVDTQSHKDQLFVAVDYDDVQVLDVPMKQIERWGAHFLCYPLVKNQKVRNLSEDPEQPVPFVYYSEEYFNTSAWINMVVGKCSTWIDCDAPDATLRLNSELALKQEASWSKHLNLPAVLAPTPTSLKVANYARVVNQIVSVATTAPHFWVPIPMVTYSKNASDGECKEDDAVEKDAETSYKIWDTLRSLCHNNSNVSLVLRLTEDVPSWPHFERWAAEPLKALILPTNVFITKANGLPALPKSHEKVVKFLLQFNVQLILSGSFDNDPGYLAYQTYLYQLHDEMPELTEREFFEKPFRDFLQAPLQPLADHLQSVTYETFERDPVKYSQYQKAIKRLLEDRPYASATVVPSAILTAIKKFLEDRPDAKTAMVVGAGRGPLVNCCLRAAKECNVDLKVYAVEKNPNAVITLKDMKSRRWKDRVEIISHDMRTWETTLRADLMVSELLGSFGDNELSPECLDGAQRFLKDDGVMIPQSYTSFLAPISTPRLWKDAKGAHASEEEKQLETAYVVKLFAFNQLAEAKALFTFSHPTPDAHKPPTHNARYEDLSFESSVDATVHGFAGYFETDLYKGVSLSINPPTFSDGMFSWFPIYFPLKQPVRVRASESIDVSFWRNVSLTENKVWYEWCLSSPTPTPIHNPNGRSYFVRL